MKSLQIALFSLVSLGTYFDMAKKNKNHYTQVLTPSQMEIINGKGCSFLQWFAAVAADIGCAVKPDPWSCLAAAGTSADCIVQLLQGGGDPAPSSGGYSGGTGGLAPKCPCPE